MTTFTLARNTKNNPAVWAQSAEASRASREYLQHAQDALNAGRFERAIECTNIATAMALAATEILRLRG